VNALSHLLSSPRNPISAVAKEWHADTDVHSVISWDQLRQDVANLQERLSDEPAGGWVLLTEDAYTFAVGLLALWHAGRHAISPPNRQPESLRNLRSRAAGILCDRPEWITEGPSVHPMFPGATGADPEKLPQLISNTPAIELYTSGTTGSEKPTMKTIAHLEDEVAELEALWGDRVNGSVFFSTASHQHLYGLLFGLLWPLAAGHVFQSQHFLHAGEAVPKMVDARSCVLATVPTHLQRLARHNGTHELRGICHLIFSSGGPLQEKTAHKISQTLESPPLEVLGSTETGGIAWRSQELGRDQNLWTPFPSVHVDRDPETRGMLVRSPFVSVDFDDAGFPTGDRISPISNGSFNLEGRLDQVVKIGEKRLDLSRMEAKLREHPLIEDLALLAIDREGTWRVAAVIVPSAEGWALLEKEGRRLFGRTLRQRLAEDWDPILHPRYWRMVDKLPENSRGKLTRTSLSQFFSVSGFIPSSSDRPTLIEEFRGVSFLERACTVPPDLSCFPGHFPDGPVVPGVLELDWAIEMAADILGYSPKVESVKSLKFMYPLRPEDLFRIKVTVSTAGKLDFRLWSKDHEFSRGRVRLLLEPVDSVEIQ
jgi:acyl-coenzyme A synthetase/AMP-(fatty) acid ligase/3-hydroxymyristoyl/3-hydroxydecanoyl-(acyl carrier protein) dehydratase